MQAKLSRVLLWQGCITILAAGLLGLSYTLPYLNYFTILWLLPLVYAGWQNQHAVTWGWLYGVIWFGVGIAWVHISIADYGGVPLLISLSMMAILCGYLALFPALFTWLIARLRNYRLHPFVIILSTPLLWYFVEWCRSWLLTGFPWLGLGYTQYNTPLKHGFAVVGETGVAAVLILCASCLVMLAHYVCLHLSHNVKTSKSAHSTSQAPIENKLPWHLSKSLLTVFLWVIALYVFAVFKPSNTTIDADKTVKIALVQGNIPQSLRWVPEEDTRTFNTYKQLTDNVWDNDIVVWPEAAVPKLEYFAQTELQLLNQVAATTNTGLVTGIVNYDMRNEKIYNNLIVLGKHASDDHQGQYYYGDTNRFAKHHLLPIGEFIPFESWLRGLAPIFDLPMSSFTRGEYIQPNLNVNGYALLPAICFEIVFPRQLRANFTAQTDAIITVSNDAWFGDSAGPIQHMRIAQVRAMEFGIPVIRATNNGITGLIEQTGDIVASLPQFTTGVLTHTFNISQTETYYRNYGSGLFLGVHLLFWLVVLFYSLVLDLFPLRVTD